MTRSMKTTLMKLCYLLAVAGWTVFLCSGCTLSVKPDGTREYAPDRTLFLRAIQVIHEK